MALAAGWWWEHQKQYRRVSDLLQSILPTKRRKVHSTEVKRKQSNLNVFSGGYYQPSCCIFESIKEEPLCFFSLLLVLYAILIIDAPVIHSLIVRSSYIQAIPVNECFEVRLLWTLSCIFATVGLVWSQAHTCECEQRSPTHWSDLSSQSEGEPERKLLISDSKKSVPRQSIRKIWIFLNQFFKILSCQGALQSDCDMDYF